MAKTEESLFELRRFKTIEGIAGDEHEVDAWRESELVGAKALAEPALGAGPGDGVAHGGAGRHEAGPGGQFVWFGRGPGRRGLARDGFAGSGTRGQRGPGSVIKHKGAAIEAAPLGADVVEIRRPTQVLVGAEAHGVEAEDREGSRLLPLDDGEALAALGATSGEDLAATLGGIAGAEADLAGAFLFVRAEGGLHGVLRV